MIVFQRQGGFAYDNGSLMRPSLALDSNRDAIRRVVAAHRACNPRVFGSVAHGDDTEDSDLDILVDPTADTSLFDIGAIPVSYTHLTLPTSDLV